MGTRKEGGGEEQKRERNEGERGKKKGRQNHGCIGLVICFWMTVVTGYSAKTESRIPWVTSLCWDIVTILGRSQVLVALRIPLVRRWECVIYSRAHKTDERRP